MPAHKTNNIFAVLLSVALHLFIVAAIWAASGGLALFNETAQTDDSVIFLELVAQPPESVSSQTEPPLQVTETPPDIALPAVTPEQIQPDRRASMAAPPWCGSLSSGNLTSWIGRPGKPGLRLANGLARQA